MKLEVFLFLFALGLAFLSGNISYFIHDDETVDLNNIDEIQKLHYELQETMSPFVRIDLNNNYSTPAHFELLKPLDNRIQKNKQLLLDSSQCIKSKINQISSKYVDKEALWLAYLCDQVQMLPSSYFKSPPFMHPSGQSYAFMNYRLQTERRARINWLENYSRFMHLSELSKLKWSQNKEQRFLNNQSPELIGKILQDEKLILTKHYYYINTGHLKYYVQTKEKAVRFFERARYIVTTNFKDCSLKVATTCWSRQPHNLKSILTQSSYMIFAVTIVILFITAKGLFSRFRIRRYEEERKKHALRLLTHELRTPIASLLLQVDQLNERLSELPEDMVDDIMRIEGQIYRLKHLADRSQSYLQTNNKDFLNLNIEKIPSMTAYLDSIRTEYKDLEINININEDFSVLTDPYWIKIVIMNIIENAKRYGKAPIQISAKRKETECIEINITDQGEIPFSNLKSLLKNKHQNSKGLGLGMIIVTRIIKELGGKLTLENFPTTFKIELKEVHNDQNIIS